VHIDHAGNTMINGSPFLDKGLKDPLQKS